MKIDFNNIWTLSWYFAAGFFSCIDQIFFKWPKKINSIRSELWTNKKCRGKFQ